MKPGIDYVGVNVCFLCHDGRGNFVMSFRSENCRDEKNKWDFGGGKIDFGKLLDETVREEIRQEYCADALEIVPLGSRDAIRMDEGIRRHWVAIDYLVKVDPEQVGNGEPHKFTEVKWFTPEKIPSNVHSQTSTFLNRYRNIFRDHGLKF